MTEQERKLRSLLGDKKAEHVIAKAAEAERPAHYLTRALQNAEISAWRRRQALERKVEAAVDRQNRAESFRKVAAELHVLCGAVTARMAGSTTTRWAHWMLATLNLFEEDSAAADVVLAEAADVSVNAVHQWRSRGLKALAPFMSEALRSYTVARTGMHHLGRAEGWSADQAQRWRARRCDLLT